MLLALWCTAGCSLTVRNQTAGTVLSYAQNRLLDITDIVSGGVGASELQWHGYVYFPSGLRLNLHATRACQLGLGVVGPSGFVGKHYRRKLLWWHRVNEVSIGPVTWCDIECNAYPACGGARKTPGMLLPSDDVFARRCLDYWAVGAEGTLIWISVTLEVHPLEVFDAFAGLLMYDPSGDDREWVRAADETGSSPSD